MVICGTDNFTSNINFHLIYFLIFNVKNSLLPCTFLFLLLLIHDCLTKVMWTLFIFLELKTMYFRGFCPQYHCLCSLHKQHAWRLSPTLMTLFSTYSWQLYLLSLAQALLLSYRSYLSLPRGYPKKTQNQIWSHHLCSLTTPELLFFGGGGGLVTYLV